MILRFSYVPTAASIRKQQEQQGYADVYHLTVNTTKKTVQETINQHYPTADSIKISTKSDYDNLMMQLRNNKYEYHFKKCDPYWEK